jgi:7-carboxy-7-deazaguanine synthase
MPPEKSIPTEAQAAPVIPGESLPVMEHFYTLQGEGFHTGTPAYFIRLAGCDVGCTWCDVKESWDAGAYGRFAPAEIAAWAAASGARRVVITGGEPLMYPLDHLCDALHRSGLRVHLETSGAYPLSGTWDWICVSPKKFRPALAEVVARAHELKAIIFHDSDMDWAAGQAAPVSAGCQLFLQPEYSRIDRVMPAMIDYVKQHPEWRISLQTHKYLNIP